MPRSQGGLPQILVLYPLQMVDWTGPIQLFSFIITSWLLLPTRP